VFSLTAEKKAKQKAVPLPQRSRSGNEDSLWLRTRAGGRRDSPSH